MNPIIDRRWGEAPRPGCRERISTRVAWDNDLGGGTLLRLVSYLLFFSASVALGAKIGDTYESVIAEYGTPKSQIQAGTVMILGYRDVSIKLRDNVVVSINAVASAPATTPTPPPKASDPQPSQAPESADAIKAQLKDAIDHVNEIVNQPVPFVPRTRENWSQCAWFGDAWFHPGAITPDFANVDVRKTQETKNYEAYQYASSNFTPDRAFVASDIEFNSMTKFFYQDRSVPKKKLTEDEMVEINRLYRVIAKCSAQLGAMGVTPEIK
jgi:hypothetical protein